MNEHRFKDSSVNINNCLHLVCVTYDYVVRCAMTAVCYNTRKRVWKRPYQKQPLSTDLHGIMCVICLLWHLDAIAGARAIGTYISAGINRGRRKSATAMLVCRSVPLLSLRCQVKCIYIYIYTYTTISSKHIGTINRCCRSHFSFDATHRDPCLYTFEYVVVSLSSAASGAAETDDIWPGEQTKFE